MKRVAVSDMRFGSYVKLFCLSGFGLGMIFGAVFLIAGLFGAQADAYLAGIGFTGLTLGLLAAVLAPAAYALVFAWFAVIMYLPFRLMPKIFKGLKIDILIREEAGQPGA